ncbi:hypothetical protein GE061_016649 [Apolygus lucorum]|uniref:Uncharacterized protein n=1 Tax=Apolygus lucorum TaxID=248454 RepID=A0A8S9XGW3_APOLU|nr:hypothetical protein GE061_016649 [Apolygus lucorum]
MLIGEILSETRGAGTRSKAGGKSNVDGRSARGTATGEVGGEHLRVPARAQFSATLRLVHFDRLDYVAFGLCFPFSQWIWITPPPPPTSYLDYVLITRSK